MNLKDKDLAALAEYWVKDWAKESPVLEQVDHMEEWEQAVKHALNTATPREMIDFLHTWDKAEQEFYDPEKWVREAFFDYFASESQERLHRLEITVGTLVKELGSEQSTITRRQLVQLKGGYTGD